MSILEIGYKNIRKIKELKLSFTRDDGTVIKNNFIMMANGTGKTTTMDLIKGLLDGEAMTWTADKVRTFKPPIMDANKGEFYITVKFDDKQYKYFLTLDYKLGSAQIETSALPKGREDGRILPEAIRGIFTKDFVRRFVFDGEQAVRTMDSSSDEAEQTIKYLYRLDKLDEIITLNQQFFNEIQSNEGNKGSSSSISNLRTRQETADKARKKLKTDRKNLQKKIKKFEDDKKEKEIALEDINKNYDQLNDERYQINTGITQNNADIDAKIDEIINLTKLPYLLSEELYERMHKLGNSMTKLKLPKTISKDFFTELANNTECVCGRHISAREKEVILKNADRYLGSDQQSILNAIKSTLMISEYDNRLSKAFDELRVLREKSNRLATQREDNDEKLLKAGGKKATELKEQIDELIGKIGVAKSELNTLESKDETDDKLNENNNIHRAECAYRYYEEKIASATRTHAAWQRKDIIEELINEIKIQATEELKQEIIRKTNEKLQKVISDDSIEIENIDQYIKLKGKDGASEGQTLSIAYCFIGTLFEDAELEFPFVIDSPTGKMDFDKRKAVADIIPDVFNQLIAFVQSAEVENFADRFYKNTDSQYVTIIASREGNDIEIHKGIDFFDSYQREHRGEVE